MVGELTWQRRLVGLWLPLAGFVVVALFPFTWIAVTSLKTTADLYDPKAMPLGIKHPSLVHYITLSQNEFLYALLFLRKSNVRPIPIGVVGELVRGDAFYWGLPMAGALLGSIPVAVIYSFFVTCYVAGLTAGAVKG